MTKPRATPILKEWKLTEQKLKDTHVDVIIPDASDKPIYRNCHLTAKSAHVILTVCAPLIEKKTREDERSTMLKELRNKIDDYKEGK